MYSRSNSRASRLDIDADQLPKDKVNYGTIDERKSEESDDSKIINLSSISKPQSQLKWSKHSGIFSSPTRKESWIGKRMLKFRRSITILLYI